MLGLFVVYYCGSVLCDMRDPAFVVIVSTPKHW
jgi:hypothetical protein